MGVDDHRIGTVEELREVIAEPRDAARLKLETALDEYAVAFIADAPFLVLSTADAEGHLDASPKGDEPGFVLVEDEHTLVIPDRPGNHLAFGLTNIVENPQVGVLFIIPGTKETLRVNGRAELSRDPALLEKLAARGRPAVLAIRVRVEECFFHCSKAFIRSRLWDHQQWPARQKVSFGAMLAPKVGDDPGLVQVIEELVEADARDNL